MIHQGSSRGREHSTKAQAWARISVGRLCQRKKKLETTYHKQVDEIFFYGYSCCIRKHENIDDIISIPSDDEVKQGKDASVADGHDTQGKNYEAQSSSAIE